MREGQALQWWTAFGTVLAGFVAVPAFFISMKALSISEQQRADTLAQRAEDQRKEDKERIALYARNVTYSQSGNLQGWVRSKDGLRIGERWILNRNTGEASVWSVEKNVDGESRAARARLPPCTGIKVEPRLADYVVFNPLDDSFWSVTSVGQSNNLLTSGAPVFDVIDRESYELEILAQRRIEPCG